MGVDPDDNAAAKVIAQRLSPEKQAWFDNLALRGAHEYAVELEEENAALRASLRAARAKYDAEERDHRLTIDTFRQQEHIWQQKYNEQEKSNAALRDQLAEAQIHLRDARSWIADVEEREAAVCPEDTAFDEYIRTLQSRLAQVTKEREFWDRLKTATSKLSESAASELADILENL